MAVNGTGMESAKAIVTGMNLVEDDHNGNHRRTIKRSLGEVVDASGLVEGSVANKARRSGHRRH